MKLTTWTAAIFLICSVWNVSSAQHRCGTQILHNQKMENDAEYRQQFLEYEKTMSKMYKEFESKGKAACTTPTYFPVAVHYDWVPSAADQAELVKLAQNQIATLNSAFNGNDCAGGANTNCFEFKLATMGHPAASGLTNGMPAVTFGGTPSADYCSTVSGDSEPCNLSNWNGYMNITVNRLSTNRCTSLGISHLPGTPNGNNSMAVNSCAFGSTGIVASGTAFVLDGTGGDSHCNCLEGTVDGGITTVHEIGHFLGLYHTFCVDDGAQGPYAGLSGGAAGTHSGTVPNNGTGCQQTDVCSSGCDPNGANPNPWSGNTPANSAPYICDCDRIVDTPPQAYSGSGCPASTSVANVSEPGSPVRNFNNYMDYGDDNCLTCFTANQYTAIMATIAANTGYKTKAQTCMPTITPMVSVTDPCNCNDPMNVTDANGDIQYFHDVLTFSGNAGLSVSCIVNCGVFKTSAGANLRISGTIPASGTLTIDFWRAPGDYTASTFQVGSLEAVLSGGTCDATPCNNVVTANPIPTVGEWGLIVLALSMMIVGVLFMSIRSVAPKKG